MAGFAASHPGEWEPSRAAISGLAKTFADGYRQAMHQHRRGQLIYACRGVMEIITAQGRWRVPPQRAIWMPAGVEHQLLAHGEVELRSLYLAADAVPAHFPSQPRAVTVTPLLRELILQALAFTADGPQDRRQHLLLALIPEEVQWSAEQALYLPQPEDARLQRICSALLLHPGDARSLTRWGEQVGASSRTLARLFQQELGMSYRLWRQQLTVQAALPRLAQGEQVSRIASDLGYDTLGAFGALFRRLMGVSPSEYAQSLQQP